MTWPSAGSECRRLWLTQFHWQIGDTPAQRWQVGLHNSPYPGVINLIITVDQYVAKPDHSAQLESGPPGLGPLSQESSTPHRLSQAGAPLPNETSDRPHRRSTSERAGSK